MAEAKGSYVGGTPVYFKDEKARAMLSNEYVPAENYAAGNLCIHEGKLYKATKATTGTWDATAWTETNLAEVNAGMQKSITDLTENKANKDHSHAWSTITGKPSSFNPASHTHDDRYYTESEMNAKLNEKLTKSLIKKKTVSSNSPDWVNAGLPVASTIFLDANVISSSKGDTNFTCVPYYNKDAKGVFLRIKDLNNNIAGSATYKVDIKYIELTL